MPFDLPQALQQSCLRPYKAVRIDVDGMDYLLRGAGARAIRPIPLLSSWTSVDVVPLGNVQSWASIVRLTIAPGSPTTYANPGSDRTTPGIRYTVASVA